MVYQGEEIGMTNYPFSEISEFRDVSSLNFYNSMEDLSETEKIWRVKKTSRDNPRTPIHWNNTKNGGFTTGTPWINVNPNYKEVNIENQLNDENSILNHYKKLFNLRLNSEYKDFKLAYVLKVKDESENCYAVAINGDEIIGFNPLDKEIDIMPEWDFCADNELFQELEWNREIIYMSLDNHYGVWNEISNCLL